MPKLIATERFFYAGRNVEAGADFEAEAQDVALLTNSNTPKARVPADSPTAQTPARGEGLFERKDEQSTDGAQQTGRVGRYKRRDMRARE